MKQIWKWTLSVTDFQEVRMPEGAVILSVAKQRGNVCLWAVVEPGNETVIRFIEVIGTGNDVSSALGLKRTFIGTVVMEPEPLVWHVFERH